MTYGQQDAQWSHYMFNQHYYNPGYVGLEQLSRVTLLHRTQWLGYETTIAEDRAGGAPSQQELSLVQPLKIFGSRVINSGVGLIFNNDKLGPWTRQDLKLDFSYHYKPRFGGTIGIGGRVGFQSQKINGGILRATDDGDVVIEQFAIQSQQIKPDFGAGIYYNSTKYYITVAMSHLNKSTFDFGADNDSIQSQLSRNIWVGAGYNIFLNQLVVTPSVHYKADFNHSSYNLGVLAQLNNYKYFAGFHVRQSIVNQAVNNGGGKQVISDDLTLLLGMSFLKDNSLRVSYAFDLVTSATKAKSNTSHEIMLSYTLNLLLDNKKTPIKDPRYRHE